MGRVVYSGIGLILGYVAVAVAGVTLSSIAAISQSEGAYMMGVFFFWAPLGAVVGGITGFLMARPKS
ncbi:hypothetical protein ACSBLW_09740 [Thioclava sp. FR2]|uniref:hypothetical protein n=1 Tax=Thioclava sp. FR2 TaxID=3445780 RepID=UPI003EB94EB0